MSARSLSTPDAAGAPEPVGLQFLTGRARTVYGGLWLLAVIVTTSTIFLTALSPGARDLASASTFVLAILGCDLLLILGLTAVMGWRAFQLFGPRTRDAGVRLHRRFVGLFALAAVAPAVIVALFFGLLVTRGVESWFSARVRSSVENSASVARAYLDEQQQVVRRGLGPIADDLNRLNPYFQASRLGFGRLLLGELASYDFTALYVIDGDGRVLARAEQPAAPAYLAPPPDMLHAAQGEAPLRLDGSDMARAVFRLHGYADAYVYVVRPLGSGIMAQLRRADASVTAYREAETSRARIQAIFALSYVATALLVLTGAVWVGIALAAQIAAPIARLVQAADRVAGGDLGARVSVDRQLEEIAILSHSFNRMTDDLQAQQEALRTASLEAQSRTRFTEAVLSDVSAGVIGLDADGRISVVNGRALTLLALDADAVAGRRLAEAAPELAEVAERAGRGGEAESEVDVTRGAEARRLRVRGSGARGSGVVLTFDDITRLLAAQRNAAWRDVARRIAHEIKNPLTPIQLSAERLRRKYRREITTDLDTFDRCTDTIIRQVADIGRMVDEFSTFARMPAPNFAEADAAELLRQAVFAQRVAYPDVAVDFDEPAGPAPLVCDGRMVAQALANVLKNAGEAVAARMASEPGLRGAIAVTLGERAGELVLAAQDNGVGLPAKDRGRLTEPYVTTREKGTGLGLAIVKRILEEHGGELVLSDSEAGRGARVELRFPRASAPAAAVPAAAE